jgi:hypothetical protein
LYNGVWTIEAALAWMRAVGFVPAQLDAVNYDSRDTTSLLEIDCVFRRASTSDAAV